jgi:hypothetical protein
VTEAIIGVAITAAASSVGYWLVYRVNRRTATTDAAQQQINGIQQDREDDRKQFGDSMRRMETRQGQLEARLELAEARERLFSDYVLTLRWHIAEEKPPPPPPFPPELLSPLERQRTDGR